jgi:hypothetical protein
MNTNIEISQISNHFFFHLKKQRENKKIFENKIVVYDFFSVNEANICDKIKEIPYYSNNYNILNDYDYIELAEVNDKKIIELNINNLSDIDKNNINKFNQYLLFKYNYDKCIPFNDFLYNLRNPKILILNLLESFSYLLVSLIKLNENNICFFNLSNENIIFKEDKPIIQDFRYSLQVSKLNESYICKIIEKMNNYTYKPLEIHVLYYIIKNNLDTLNDAIVEQICNNYTDNLSILELFSQNYIDSFKKECMLFLKKYVNMSKTLIIANILEYNDKWDVYSLSILYLHIFGTISRFFSLKETFISKLIVVLCKNIHPEPLKRESLEGTREIFENLLNNCSNWSFVNQMSGKKINKLFELL